MIRMVDGDPVANLARLTDPRRSRVVIMKDGHVCMYTLSRGH